MKMYDIAYNYVLTQHLRKNTYSRLGYNLTPRVVSGTVLTL